MKVLKIKLLVHAYIIIRNTVCTYNMGRGGAEPPGFQTVTDYLIYTSRLCNSYYMAMTVTICLLCLGAHAQARYTVVCLSVCLSVSPTTFSRSATGYTYILCRVAIIIKVSL